MKTWRCPKCGTQARTHKAVKEAICTRHIAHKPVRMVEEQNAA